MKTISINGYVLDRSLLVDDPEIKRTMTDAMGQARHIRSFSQPGKLKSYLKSHPEGIILAGAGSLLFIEPVPVSASMISFDELGNAHISIRDVSQQIERQMEIMNGMRAAAIKLFYDL